MESIERRPAVVVVLIHPFEGQSQETEDEDEYQIEPELVSSSSATLTSFQVYSSCLPQDVTEWCNWTAMNAEDRGFAFQILSKPKAPRASYIKARDTEHESQQPHNLGRNRGSSL